MKNHRLQYPLQKDRNYLVIESRACFAGFDNILLWFDNKLLPQDLNLLVLNIKQAIIDNDTVKFNVFLQEARQLAWKYLKTSNETDSEFLLLFCDFISNFSWIHKKVKNDEI